MEGNTAQIIKFPTSRIVRSHWLNDETPELVTLDHALRSIERAIAALGNQRRSLATRYQQAAKAAGIARAAQ